MDPADEPTMLAKLAEISGPSNVLTGGDVTSRDDGYPWPPMQASCIVRPGTTAEVSRVLAYCNDSGLKVVPQGGRTGLAGGARTAKGEVALSLERMNGIDPVDIYGATVSVDAGAPLQSVQAAAAAAALLYPVDIGARGSATIGGTISTNAGGYTVIRYGMTRNHVLGLEVVLADGTVMSSMNRLMKNNAGYDLKHMFVGSEGTLGVITRAVLRLQPAAGLRATALIGVDRFSDVLALLVKLSAQTEGMLTAFEVMWRDFTDRVLASGAHNWPLDRRYAFTVLVEVAAARSAELLEAAVADALSAGIIGDAVLAQNLSQASAIWAIRDDIKSLSTAQKPMFGYDISLPQSAMEDYVERLRAALRQGWPELGMVVYGHLGDGNLHIGILGGDKRSHDAIDDVVYGLLGPLNGSISAEHGIGLDKRDHLAVSRTPEEIELMRRLKQALDPRNTLNPGKVLPL